MKDTIIIDTETTGLLSARATSLEFQPHLIEIYILRIDSKNKFVADLDALVKPPVPIPDFITKITGINDLMVAKEPTFADIAKDVLKICKGTKTFVAHNASFDYNIVVNEYRRIDNKKFSKLKFDFFCTVEQSFDLKGYRLKNLELYEILTGKTFITNQHRAKADVLATFENYKELLKRIK